MRHGLLATFTLWMGATLGGCSALSDLDRFRTGDAGAAQADAGADAGVSLGCDNPATLCLRLDEFMLHSTHLVVADLVSADGNLRARAMLDPMSNDDPIADIVMPVVIPQTEVPGAGQAHPLHLELWADATGDREYTPTPADASRQDHDWRIPLPANASVVFQHNTVFSNLVPRPQPIGGDFEMSLTGFGIHAGAVFEAMVIEAASGRTVGLYRLQSVPQGGEFTITIPGIIDSGDGQGGTVYRIEYFADLNDNGVYDGLPTDHSWVATAESDADGLRLLRPHSSDPASGIHVEFEQLSYQFPFL